MTVRVPTRRVAGLPRYLPGQAGWLRRRATYKLSSNENPYPPLPGVLAGDRAGVRADEPLSGHGQRRDHRGRGGPARRGQDQLAFGTGSVAVLYQLLQAVCEPGDEVVYAWRSFEAYPIAVQLTGATPGAGAAGAGRGS